MSWYISILEYSIKWDINFNYYYFLNGDRRLRVRGDASKIWDLLKLFRFIYYYIKFVSVNLYIYSFWMVIKMDINMK